MNEIAIFTLEVADELIVRGFDPVGGNEVATFFEDSDLLRDNLSEILTKYL